MLSSALRRESKILIRAYTAMCEEAPSRLPGFILSQALQPHRLLPLPQELQPLSLLRVFVQAVLAALRIRMSSHCCRASTVISFIGPSVTSLEATPNLTETHPK